MKKLLCISMLACLHAFTIAFSADVSSGEAREAVAGWATLGDALTGGTQFTASGIKGVATYDAADGLGKFHVVSFEGGGYAVTSGDTEVAPILAYSPGGEFVASEENPLWCLLVQDVAGRTKKLEGSVKKRGMSANASAWARLRDAAATPAKPLLKAALPRPSAVADLRVGPLCKTRWYQHDEQGGHCFNYYTPSNVVCGCTATALGQIMKSFKWPNTKVELGGNSYSGTFTEIVDISDTESVTNVVEWHVGGDYGDTWEFGGPAFGGYYDWDNMPDIPSQGSLTEEQRQAIGRLCRDCGIAMRMSYAASGSAAHVTELKLRLTDQFGYKNSVLLFKSSAGDEISADDYIKAMVANFDLGSPCAVGIPGHEIVSDGYGYSDGRFYIHFNWGWGDNDSTAWYTPALTDEESSDYPSINSMVCDIYTPEMCPEAGRTVVSGRVTGEGGDPVVGVDVLAEDTESGAKFAATTGETGIYALLLPPKRAYVIRTEKDGWRAATTRNVEETVSKNILAPGRMSGTAVVSSLPFTDLSLAAGSGAEGEWLRENVSTTFLTGKWSEAVEYDGDGRAYLGGNVVFTPYNTSTGNVVAVETKAQFHECTEDSAPGATVQAAVRLGTNGNFQVWSNGAWLDVAAAGVTPVSGEEYTLRTTFDYTASTYSVDVNDSALELQLETPTRSFPFPAQTNCVTSIAFVGDTLFTSLYGDCRYEIIGFAENDALVLSNNVEIVLNAARAAWLNKCAGGDKAAVASAAATLTAKELNDSYLLNLDITEDNSYTFEVTDIDVGDTSVTVAVTLTRTGKIAQKINGTLKFYGAATLAAFKAETAAPLASTTIVVSDFSDGDTTTATFEKNGNTFFNAKIEEAE